MTHMNKSLSEKLEEIAAKARGDEYTRPLPYSLRLEPDMREKLEEIAKANGRSLNTQIVMVLESFLQSEEVPTMNDDLEERMRQIAKEVFTEMQAQKPNKKKPG